MRFLVIALSTSIIKQNEEQKTYEKESVIISFTFS